MKNLQMVSSHKKTIQKQVIEILLFQENWMYYIKQAVFPVISDHWLVDILADVWEVFTDE